MSLLTFLSFRSLLITLFHSFLGRPLTKLLVTLMFPHLLDQTLSSIPARWPNHCSLLSCRHSLMLLYLGLTLHIYLTILASFISILITSSDLTGQVSLSYSIMLPTHAACNLPYATKVKSPLASKAIESLKLHHPPWSLL